MQVSHDTMELKEPRAMARSGDGNLIPRFTTCNVYDIKDTKQPILNELRIQPFSLNCLKVVFSIESVYLFISYLIIGG